MRVFRSLTQIIKTAGRRAIQQQALRNIHTTAGWRQTVEEAWPRAVTPGEPPRTSTIPETRTWSDGYVVRQMRREDAPYLSQYFTDHGILGRDDIDVGYEFSSDQPGKGFYVGLFRDQIVCNLIYYEPAPGILYASMYYTPPQYRGLSFGARLRGHVEPHIIGSDKILVVDAFPKIAKVLTSRESEGWSMHWRTLRFQGRLPTRDSLPDGIMHGREVPFEAIMDYDDRCFLRPRMPSRRGFMERWTQLEGGATVVAVDRHDEVVGFAVRRPALEKNHHLIGPMYAENGNVAERLLLATAYQMSETDEYTIDTWERNSDAIALMQKYRFRERGRLYHMYQNGNPRDYNPRLFSVTSIDVCNY